MEGLPIKLLCRATFIVNLRWPEHIYMRVGYVFESRFSAGKIQPISMTFGILTKE